jgi:hypothetical protein
MAQWLLTPKAQAIHLLSAQMPPQPLFRKSHLSTQLFGALINYISGCFSIAHE